MVGFLEFSSTTNKLEQNVLTHRNIISPFAKISNISNSSTQGQAFIDENYGLVYDDYFLNGETAIYGQTDLLPTYSGDQLANFGFLRVPFRKIPRIYVNDKQELLSIISSIESRDPNMVLLYRGQSSEHCVQRSKDTLTTLYGSTDVIEPSLITSAARKNLKLEEILPSWMPILNLYIDSVLNELPRKVLSQVDRKIRNFQCGSNFSQFALAMAQHYGLPSVGLDVTPDLDVALFFAFKKFVTAGTSSHYKYTDNKDVDPDKPPVIYIMAPTEAQQLNYFDFKPSVLPFLRPDMQKARFMHTGWGLNKNFAATRIFLAIYLNPTGDFGSIKSPMELFPTQDSFAQLISNFKEGQRHDDPIFAKFLEGFYIVD